jgi:hypothetical protein
MVYAKKKLLTVLLTIFSVYVIDNDYNTITPIASKRSVHAKSQTIKCRKSSQISKILLSTAQNYSSNT